MVNQQFIGQKARYTIAKEIGKGGEGSVYELSNTPLLVLKIYSEQLKNEKIRKLELMCSLVNQQVNAYTAWPQDIVKDGQGIVRGFVMKKLVNYVPLHMLFSPMDRKKLFPDKGYNFLVHVARNLASAFHACHEGGLVIGDVNEGNILVNNQGMVAFIDCDSFQVKDGNTYHFCEVGVPRYTPPELLEKSTFQNEIRTINTDSFSMAVIIFQLLFLGRHPFAGKNKSNEDIDEEAAIKNLWFAFSLRNKSNKLIPPNDSYDIRNLTEGLTELFHNSFERINNRPLSTKWVMELSLFLNGLVPCKKSKIHIYPSKLLVCPWCSFKENRNILYFLDDSNVLQPLSLADIEKFVNGFKIEKLQFPKINFPTSYPNLLIASPVDNKYNNYKWYNRLTMALPIATGIALVFLNGWFILGGLAIAAIMNNNLPWGKKIKAEVKRRNIEFTQIKGKLESAVKEFNSPGSLKNYENSSMQIEKLILHFKNLPNELESKRKIMEERLYNIQLQLFLSNFNIRDYSIPSFGPTRKLSLYTAGIRNASEISKLHRLKVQGIGSAFEQILFSWQRQVSSKFIYHPDNNLIQNEQNVIIAEIEQTKRYLENEIKKEHQSLHYLKVNILSRQEQLKKYIDNSTKQYFQAELDYQEFKKKFT